MKSCLAAAPLAAGPALAQTPACEQYKATLAARFDASGVSGYSLEAIGAEQPVPAGLRVIGNCEGGAYNIVFRRRSEASGAGASRPAAGGAPSAPGSATAAAPRPAGSAAAPRATASGAALRDATAATAARAATDATAARAAPVATATRAAPGTASAPVVPGTGAPGTVAPSRTTAGPAGTLAVRSEPMGPPEPDRSVMVAAPAPASAAAAAGSAPQPAAEGGVPRVGGLLAFVAARWPLVLGTVVLLALAIAYGVWRARYSPYDWAGLPRGPRL